jgi:acyl carrier protein
MSEAIEQKIAKIVVDNIHQGNLKLNGGISKKSRLKFDLGADSFDMVLIVMEIENYYEIDIDDEDLDRYGDEISVGDLVYEVSRAIADNG